MWKTNINTLKNIYKNESLLYQKQKNIYIVNVLKMYHYLSFFQIFPIYLSFLCLGSNYNGKGSNHGQQKMTLHLLSLKSFFGNHQQNKDLFSENCERYENEKCLIYTVYVGRNSKYKKKRSTPARKLNNA